MIIYNITYKVDHSSLEEWFQWQNNIHIPEIMATSCFYDHRFYELLEHEEEDGKTFVLQFYAHSKKDYNHYLQKYAPGLRERSQEKWKSHVVSFRTLLQPV